MCGIVAYSGYSKNLMTLLYHGLQKLEYRGYDSSGLAFFQNQKLQVYKESGKLKNLTLPNINAGSGVGIAHTRWATHGSANKLNAHPHISQDERIAIAHNGIVENYIPLKEELLEKGYKFQSETDSEVIVHLISSNYHGDLVKACQKAISRIQGTYGLVAISMEEPDVLIGARRGSPLVLGICPQGIHLASDVTPMLKHTQEVVYLDDGDLVRIEGDKYQILNTGFKEVNREVQYLNQKDSDAAKAGFPHYMLKEIFEQPSTIGNTMRGRLLIAEGTAKLSGLEENIRDLRELERIILVACGTSYYASMVGEYLIEDFAGIPVEVEYASEFRYRNPIITSRTAVLVLSQSGETADSLAALLEAKRKGATVLGICNTVGSSIARATDGGVYLHAGPEIGVASTKAFTAQVTVLSLFALLLGRMRRVSNSVGSRLATMLSSLPIKVEEALLQKDSVFAIAEKYKDSKNFLYIGRNVNYPVALEGALKLKEISYIHAEGYAAAELKHGPIALLDENMPVIVIASKDDLHEKLLSNVKEIKARGAKVISILPQGEVEIARESDDVIYVPEVHPAFSALVNIIPLQLFAYQMAVLNDRDVDQPRNLAKSVTVE